MTTCNIHQAIDDFRRGKCVFYLTPAGHYPAVLTRHYETRHHHSHGFSYLTKYPQPPKFVGPTIKQSIQKALSAGREVMVGETLLEVLQYCETLRTRK